MFASDCTIKTGIPQQTLYRWLKLRKRPSSRQAIEFERAHLEPFEAGAQETEQDKQRLTTAGTQEHSRDIITGFPRPVPEVIPVSIEAKLDEILALLKQLIGEKKVVVIEKRKARRKL